jgi:hypothetical protein
MRRNRVVAGLVSVIRRVRLPRAFTRSAFVASAVLAVGCLGVFAAIRLLQQGSRPAHEVKVDKALAWLRAHEPADGSWRFCSAIDGQDIHNPPATVWAGPACYLGSKEPRHAEPGVGADSR